MTYDHMSGIIDFSLANQMEKLSLNWVPINSYEQINWEAEKITYPCFKSEEMEIK